MITLNTLKKTKIYTILVFVCLAFGALVFTKLNQDYTKTIVLKINPVNVPETSILVLNDSHKINVTLRAKGAKWLEYAIKPPKIEIDFIQDTENKDSVYIWSSNKAFFKINSQFNSNTSLIKLSPKQLMFKYDVFGTKKVPVKPNVKLTFGLGYNILGKMTLKPDSVKIIGPSSIIKQIQFIETEHVNLKEIQKTVSRKLALKVDSINQIRLSPEKVILKAKVEKFTEGTADVPIIVTNIPKGKQIKYFPKYVTVSYNTSLEAYKTISTSNFKVICDYEKVGEKGSFLIPELTKIPNNIKNPRIHQQKIEFIITE